MYKYTVNDTEVLWESQHTMRIKKKNKFMRCNKSMLLLALEGSISFTDVFRCLTKSALKNLSIFDLRNNVDVSKGKHEVTASWAARIHPGGQGIQVSLLILQSI